MTIDEVREAIGRKVVYRSRPDAEPEEGVIVANSTRYAFVRFAAEYGAKATPPEYLTLLSA